MSHYRHFVPRLFVLLLALPACHVHAERSQTSSVPNGAPPSLYVDASRPDDSGDGLTWSAAKRTIQAAVDIASVGATVWVTNGVYTPSPEIYITNAIIIKSVNGFAVTIVRGGGAWQPVRDHPCFRIADCAAILEGFTIRDGRGFWMGAPLYEYQGGGIFCATGDAPRVVACVITENFAERGGGMTGGTAVDCVFSNNAASMGCGGGMDGGVAERCVFIGNRCSVGAGAGKFGGTAMDCVFLRNEGRNGSCGGGQAVGTAIRCWFEDNVADCGGGMGYGIADNCVFIGNASGGLFHGAAVSCTFSGNTAYRSGFPSQDGLIQATASNCVVWPDTVADTVLYSCWTNDPSFVDAANGNFHLRYGSPCIDASLIAGQEGDVDLDGEVRPYGGVMDIGADEFVDTDGDHIPDYWESAFFADTTNAVPIADTDGDDLDEFGEYFNGTDPHDRDSDHDTMPDGWEVAQLLLPSRHDASLDPDSDGMDNAGEYAADTDPHANTSVLSMSQIRIRDGWLRVQWRGGEQAWQFLEGKSALTNTMWHSIIGLPPPRPVTNEVLIPDSTPYRHFRIHAVRD